MKELIIKGMGFFITYCLASTATAGVTPASVDATLNTGSSTTVEKTVTTPVLPPKLDLCLDIDLSGSYRNDLQNIKDLAGGLFDDIRTDVADSQFCVTSFRDFPVVPWGGASDFAYSLDQDLTIDKTTWTGALNALTAGGGYDGPESQYESLYQAATGSGRDIPPVGSSNPGDILPGLKPSWRTDATKVIAITTDAPFHYPGDGTGPYIYPGPTRNDTVNALNAEGIKVLALKAPGSTLQMDDVAGATGGTVQLTTDTSSDIAQAILDGLEELSITVTPTPLTCDSNLELLFTPTSQTVTSGSDAEFSEAIGVVNDPGLEGMTLYCTVDFQDENGTSLGTQDISITVADTIPPQTACLEGVNPADNTPAATNEDGFFGLTVNDNVDPDPVLYVVDLGSGMEFGPFPDTTTIKYIQAPGAPAKLKEFHGEVDWKITGNGDFQVYGVDASGNTSTPTTCYVPPPPK